MRYNHIIVSRKIVNNNKTLLVGEVRSLPEGEYSKPTVILVKFRNFKGRNQETFKVKFPYINYDINLVYVFRALGVICDKDIIEMIMQGSTDRKMLDVIIHTIEEGMLIQTQIDALVHIAKKAQSFKDVDKDTIAQHAINIINRDLFPHMGKTESNFRSKAIYLGNPIHLYLCVFLGYVAYRILLVHFGAPTDNRDHYANKRIDLAGPLLGNLKCRNRLIIIEEIYCEMIDNIKRDITGILGKWLR